MIGGDCHLVRLLWLHPAGRLQVTVVWIGPLLGQHWVQTRRSVYGSWALSVGDSTRTRLITSASARGRVQGESLRQGRREAGIRAYM